MGKDFMKEFMVETTLVLLVGVMTGPRVHEFIRISGKE